MGCATAPSSPDEAAAEALAARVLGGKARHFIFTEIPSETDVFVLEQEGRKVRISGNSANSMAVGLNHYLKYYCHVEYGWFKEDSFKLPARLPKLSAAVRSEARVPQRFFLNYCTYGYTMPWWQWEDWEHFIDWMALNGVNLPLAITGQEAIWYQIWTEMGLSDEEVRGYFTGPAHLPWHRMQNIDRWGGPLPQSWLTGQMELQKKIVARERELNMRPVLPAFSGHVPRELQRIYPDAPMTRLEAWAGYPDEYACTFLDPMSELYCEIQKKFVEKETEIYGSDHVYGIDIFNELMPPSWEPDYLGRVSRQVYESLVAADPDATWLQMGWLFYNERRYWTEERVEAYLTSFPTDRQIILDYYCERMEVWRRTESFYGVPYIWCLLGNFGGNTALVGRFRDINERLETALAEGGDNLTGIGATLEGFDCNPYVYEFLLEKAWDLPQHEDIALWTESLADQRLGFVSEEGRAAWKRIIDSVYVDSTVPGQSPYMTQRPNIGKAKTYYSNARLKYANEQLTQALGVLLELDGRNNAYLFDLVNLTRQALSNRFDSCKRAYDVAYRERDRAAMDSISAEMLEIMDDTDRLLASQSYFLVGKWISNARSWGTTPEEKDYFESNARNLLTTWSDKAQLLNDYASRSWNGLIGSFYKIRWQKFFSAVSAALDDEAASFDGISDGAADISEAWDEAHYQAYSEDVTSFEKSWWTDRPGSFPSTPVGDSKQITAELYKKYFGSKEEGTEPF